jgi:hypothetical protein
VAGAGRTHHRRSLATIGTTLPTVARRRSSRRSASALATPSSPLASASRTPLSNSASVGSAAAAERGGTSPDGASSRGVPRSEDCESCGITRPGELFAGLGGARGRGFESRRPDWVRRSQKASDPVGFFLHSKDAAGRRVQGKWPLAESASRRACRAPSSATATAVAASRAVRSASITSRSV